MAKISVFEFELKRITVIGSNGKLGTSFAQLLSSLGYRETFRETMIITKWEQNDFVSNLNTLFLKSQIIINCIGLVGVKVCAENQERAEILNGYLPEQLAKLSALNGSKFVQISTPSVFSGRNAPYIESDLPDADSVYGKSKALGEALVLAANPGALVIRINFVGIFESKENIGSIFLENALQNRAISAFTNSVFSPTYVNLVTEKIFSISESEQCGIYHFNNPNSTSKYQFAIDVYQELNCNLDLVRPDLFDHQNYEFSPNTTLESKRQSNLDLEMTNREIAKKLLSDHILMKQKGQ